MPRYCAFHRLPWRRPSSTSRTGTAARSGRSTHGAAGSPVGGERAARRAAQGRDRGCRNARDGPRRCGTAAGEWPHHQPEPRTLHGAAAAAEPAERRLAFVLHAHLRGCSATPLAARRGLAGRSVAHCYLPLVSALRRCGARGGRHLLTVSVSPVLAAQLADRARRRSPPATSSTAATPRATSPPVTRWPPGGRRPTSGCSASGGRSAATCWRRSRRSPRRTPSSSRPAPPPTVTCRCCTAASTSRCSWRRRGTTTAAGSAASPRGCGCRSAPIAPAVRGAIPPPAPRRPTAQATRPSSPRREWRWTVVDAHLAARRRSAGAYADLGRGTRGRAGGTPRALTGAQGWNRNQGGSGGGPAGSPAGARCASLSPHAAYRTTRLVAPGRLPRRPALPRLPQAARRERAPPLEGDRRGRRSRRQAPLPPGRGDGRGARPGASLSRAARRHRRARRRRRRLPLRCRAVWPLVVRRRRLARGGARPLPRRRAGDHHHAQPRARGAPADFQRGAARRVMGRGGRSPRVGERRHHLDVGGPAPRRGGGPSRATNAAAPARPRGAGAAAAARRLRLALPGTTGTAADYAADRFRLHRDACTSCSPARATARCPVDRRGPRRIRHRHRWWNGDVAEA